MPFHMLPISRRRFLATSMATGVGLCTLRPLPAGEGSDDADRWVLLADSHIAADPAVATRGVNMTDNLTRVVAAVAALSPRPCGVMLDGDAAYLRGEVADYTQVARLFRPLGQAGIGVHLTMGNHDQRDNYRTGLLRGAGGSPLTSRHVAVVETARANWFLLDSLDRTNMTPGALGDEQLNWLGRGLDARSDKPALVVVHHDPQWSTATGRTGLIDTERLFAVLVQRTQVKAVFCAHTHRWHRERRDNIHLVNLPPVAYVFSQGQPNGWVDLRLRDGCAVKTLHTLDARHRQNGETTELAWR